MSEKTKRLTIMGMLCAIAYLVMLIKIPIVPAVGFLTYEPKDVIITIGGFMLGPMAAVSISVVVSLIEMVTVSDTGPIGLVMNVLASCAFAATASAIYKKKHNTSGAVIGLGAGIVVTTAVMLLWNYLITPSYMGVPREIVVDLLIPGFMPFNLLKTGINSALVIFLYKPVVLGLRRLDVLPPSGGTGGGGRAKAGIYLVGFALLCTCVLIVLVLTKKI
ncbi:MAG: ECF transporter S component [Oscillospiraceae bacterium]|jgi:riboflavin transporter FmnP|nr:ECF transporter S component [Oscillospiraceae bacterium]